MLELTKFGKSRRNKTFLARKHLAQNNRDSIETLIDVVCCIVFQFSLFI